MQELENALNEDPDMARELRERLDEIQQNLTDHNAALTNHGVALHARLNDAARLTDAVRVINDRNNVVEPQNRSSFAQLDTFKGRLGDDFSRWIRRFEDVAAACNWNDDRKLQILPALLVENAHEIYHAIPAANRATYDALKQLLINQLQPAENRQIKATELHARKQGMYESIDDYSSDVQRLARGAYSAYPDQTRNQLLLDAFLRGLKTDMRQMVTISNPPDFPTALATARRLEAQQTMTANSAASESVAALLQVLPVLAAPPPSNLPNPPQQERGRSENRRDQRSRDNSRESSTDRLSREVDQLRREFSRLGDNPGPRYRPYQNNSNFRSYQNNNSFRPYQFTTDGRPRCTYCRRNNHTRATCRVLEADYGNERYNRPPSYDRSRAQFEHTNNNGNISRNHAESRSPSQNRPPFNRSASPYPDRSRQRSGDGDRSNNRSRSSSPYPQQRRVRFKNNNASVNVVAPNPPVDQTQREVEILREQVQRLVAVKYPQKPTQEPPILTLPSYSLENCGHKSNYNIDLLRPNCKISLICRQCHRRLPKLTSKVIYCTRCELAMCAICLHENDNCFSCFMENRRKIRTVVPADEARPSAQPMETAVVPSEVPVLRFPPPEPPWTGTHANPIQFPNDTGTERTRCSEAAAYQDPPPRGQPGGNRRGGRRRPPDPNDPEYDPQRPAIFQRLGAVGETADPSQRILVPGHKISQLHNRCDRIRNDFRADFEKMEHRMRQCERQTFQVNRHPQLNEEKIEKTGQNLALCQHTLQQHITACQQTISRHAEALKADLVTSQTLADRTYQATNQRLFRLETRFDQTLPALPTLPTDQSAPMNTSNPEQEPDPKFTTEAPTEAKPTTESGDEGEESSEPSDRNESPSSVEIESSDSDTEQQRAPKRKKRRKTDSELAEEIVRAATIMLEKDKTAQQNEAEPADEPNVPTGSGTDSGKKRKNPPQLPDPPKKWEKHPRIRNPKPNQLAKSHPFKSTLSSAMVLNVLASLAGLVLLLSMLPTSRADPMFCQTAQGRTLWKIPAPPKCEYKQVKNHTQNRIPTSLQLYKRNEIQYKTTGYHCRKVKQTIKTFVYFFNDERLKEENTIDIPVSKAECDRMRKWKICKEGKMIEKGGILQTEHQLNWKYSGGGAYCCSWNNFEVTNCFAYKVYVYKRHRSITMQSTAGNVAHCTYKNGVCILKDSSALIWDVNLQEHCQYLPWRILAGDRLGTNWIANDHNLALTWSLDDPSDAHPRSCNGKQLIMSQQGIPFRVQSSRPAASRKWMKNRPYCLPRYVSGRRLKRENDPNDHGYVTTELLAGTLQAIATEVAEGVQYAYSHALTATCQNMRQLHNLLRALIYANPIMAARALLNKDHIYARSGGEILEIWPCETVEPEIYSFLPMNKTCSLEIPIKLNRQSGSKIAYMDPKTGILHLIPTLTDCSLEEEIPFTKNNQSWLYHRKTGDARLAEGEINSLEFYHPEVLEWLPWKTTVYHQIVMYNFSELQGSISLNDIYSSLDRQKQILTALGVKRHQGPNDAATDITERVMEHGFFGFLYGLRINPLQIWTFLVCVYVTIGALSFHCCPTSGAKNYLHVPTVAGHIKKGMQSLAARYRNSPEIPDPDYVNVIPDTGAPITLMRSSSLFRRLRRDRLPIRDDIGPPVPPHRHVPVRPVRPPRSRSSPPSSPPPPLQQNGNIPSAPQLYYPIHQLPLPDPIPEPPQVPREANVGLDSHKLQAHYSPTDRLLTDTTLFVHYQMGAEIVISTIVGQQETKALMDTGACFSLMPHTKAKQLKEAENLSRALPLRVSMGGKTYPIYGSIITTVTIGNHSVRAPIVVVGGGDYDLILGTDLQAIFGYIGVDYVTNTVHTPLSGPVPYGRLNSIYATPVRMGLDKTEAVPARVRTILYARPDTELFPNSEYIFEPQQKGLDKKGIYSGRAIINSDQGGRDSSIPVQIMNASDHVVTLYENTTLGHLYFHDGKEMSLQPQPNIKVFPITSLVEKLEDKKRWFEDQAVADHSKWPKAVNPPNLPKPKVQSGTREFLDQINWEGADLTQPQKNQITDLLMQYQDVFSKDDNDLGRCALIKHRIHTGDAAPISQRPYRTPYAKRELIKREIKHMLEAGVIEESHGPWSSPIVIVENQTENLGSALIFLKRPEEIFDALHGATRFSTLDISQSFWQIEVDPVDREKTGFTTEFGNYQWIRLPYGLSNSPATQCRAMEMVLTGLEWENCLIYVDDTIVYSPTFEQHLEDLAQVFDRFRQHDLRLKLKKCRFGRESAKFLGHIVSADGLKPDPEKIQSVVDWPTPTNLTMVMQFMGLTSYYRRFIESFSKIATPLNELKKKDVPFVWSPQCEAAF
ncbi:MAG: hypothetical protein GY847_03470, partial [Proteobacteria bacterium]|nr:hypothetical protein [Pseudomonadota bacterium]